MPRDDVDSHHFCTKGAAISHEQMKDEREAFWTALAAEGPELGIDPSPGWEKEIRLSKGGLIRIKMSLSQDKTSVYLVARSPEAKIWINENLDMLAKGLRTAIGQATGEASHERWFRKDNKASVTIRRQWPEAIRWLRVQYQTFYNAVRNVEDA